MPRELLLWTANLARLLRLPAPYEPDVARAAYSPRARMTHRVGIFRFAYQKRDALAAHRSRLGTGTALRMFRLLLRLPPQAFGLLFPREWFVHPALSPGTVLRDIFDRPSQGHRRVCALGGTARRVVTLDAHAKPAAGADISGSRTTTGS